MRTLAVLLFPILPLLLAANVQADPSPAKGGGDSCRALLAEFRQTFQKHYDAHEYDDAIASVSILTRDEACANALRPEQAADLFNDLAVALHHADRDEACVKLLDDGAPFVARVTDRRRLDALGFNRGLCGGACAGQRPTCVKGGATRAKQQAKAH